MTTAARGVYVHIPFCIVRCGYCDFNAYAGMDELAAPYVEALLKEIDNRADGDVVTTVFFGGGTPTQLPPEQLGRILQRLRERLEVTSGAEITVEANPETLNPEVAAGLLEYGFNRISIGVQSTSAKVLEQLERVHSADRAIQALECAVAAGFDRVNADLIYGTPGETMQEWRASLARVLSTGVTHVSAYALTVEEGTPLSVRVARGDLPAPDEDDLADKYDLLVETLRDAGLGRYEVSNFAREGHECVHNIGYWKGADYFGFGAGAHSHCAGRRSWNVRLPRTYIDRSPSVEDGFETLEPEQRRGEAAVLALRLVQGIRRRDFAQMWGTDPVELWPGPIAGGADGGILHVDEETVRCTDKGFLLMDGVARQLV